MSGKALPGKECGWKDGDRGGLANGEPLRQKEGMLWVDRAGDRRCQAILV